MTSFKALVLTCDRYHPLAEHMIRSYERHWPDHPFTFHIPFQKRPTALEARLGEIARFVEAPAPIKQTASALLQDIDDEEWVYWSIDDKYLIELDARKAAQVAGWVGGLSDPRICGVSFARSRRMLRPDYVRADETIDDGLGGSYLRRVDFSQIWLHQFLRAKVLKSLFGGFPDEDFQAKAMDAMKEQMVPPADRRLYVSEANHVVFGESTTRGKLTVNCARSLAAYGLDAPAGMELADADITIGKLPPPPPPARGVLRRFLRYVSRQSA